MLSLKKKMKFDFNRVPATERHSIKISFTRRRGDNLEQLKMSYSTVPLLNTIIWESQKWTVL